MSKEEEKEFCKYNDEAICNIHLLDGTIIKIKLIDSIDYIKANRHLIKIRKFNPRRPMFED